MATEILNSAASQPSLYDPVNRKINYIFDIPNGGVNKDTGIMLFICGYGASPQSNVFKKMRGLFADKYNMITVQCEYFGLEYMWNPKDITNYLLNNLMSREELSSLSATEFNDVFMDRIRDKKFYRIVRQDESLATLNDMGPVQAMDNLISLYYVNLFLHDNGIVYDKNKVIAFGNSHGAYLAELCNSYMPGVFSAIIDIGGYVFPNYLSGSCKREILSILPEYNTVVDTLFDDLIKYIATDTEIYDLKALYTTECSRSRIIAFHGEKDYLTPVAEKRDYIHRSGNWDFNLITDNDVDGEIFKNADHSLGADFIKLIDHVFDNYTLRSGEEKMMFSGSLFVTDSARYEIGLNETRPYMSFEPIKGYDREELIRIVNSRPKEELIRE